MPGQPFGGAALRGTALPGLVMRICRRCAAPAQVATDRCRWYNPVGEAQGGNVPSGLCKRLLLAAPRGRTRIQGTCSRRLASE
jgi:hypothetical protein